MTRSHPIYGQNKKLIYQVNNRETKVDFKPQSNAHRSKHTTKDHCHTHARMKRKLKISRETLFGLYNRFTNSKPFVKAQKKSVIIMITLQIKYKGKFVV